MQAVKLLNSRVSLFQSIIWNFRILFLFLQRVEPAKPLNEAQIGGSFYLL